MSHFKLIVIGDNAEDLVAPFQENNMGDCPRGFLEFEESEENLEKVDEETGKYGYWENPMAKWDYHVRGGRYDNCLKLKKGGYANQALKKDIDFKGIENEAENEGLNYYDLVSSYVDLSVKGKTLSFDECKDKDEFWDQPFVKRFAKMNSFKKSDYKSESDYFQLIWMGADNIYELSKGREDYIERCKKSSFSAFAFVRKAQPNALSNDKNKEIYHGSEWIDRGEMGWWGCVSKEKEIQEWEAIVKKVMKETSENELITVLDCHI